MRDMELREERDREVYRTYVKGLESEGFSNMNDAADWVRFHPAPKFYLSAKNLVNYLCISPKGRRAKNLNLSTRRKIEELQRRYEEYLAQHPDNTLSKERICELLVEENAPEFYLAHDSTIQILQRQRNKRQEEIIRRYAK